MGKGTHAVMILAEQKTELVKRARNSGLDILIKYTVLIFIFSHSKKYIHKKKAKIKLIAHGGIRYEAKDGEERSVSPTTFSLCLVHLWKCAYLQKLRAKLHRNRSLYLFAFWFTTSYYIVSGVVF